MDRLEVKSPSEFANAVCEEVRAGRSFVPLLGSGFSAPSGIPTIGELAHYLDYCVLQAVDGSKPWHPRTWKWPEFSEARSVDRWKWVRDHITALCDRGESRGLSEEVATELQAVGALADWRASLGFLSRVQKAGGRVSLDVPNSAVIDSLFSHLIGGRQPNAGQMMLAHLADGLRLRTLLTTNFDSLVEQAFERLAMPLDVFDVHHQAELPDAHLLAKRRSIVKIHGGRYGLRADASLDYKPTNELCDRFASYFRNDDGSSKHLLIIGMSGNDRRTIELLKATTHLQKELFVFWLGYDQCDVNHVKKLVDSHQIEARRLRFTVQSDIGLLLLELYQRLYHSLPPGGADFVANWRRPPSRYTDDRLDVAVFKKQVGELTTALDGGVGNPRVILVTGNTGVTSVASEVYDRRGRKEHCVWIELDQLSGVEEFLGVLTEAVAAAVGQAAAAAPLATITPATCAAHIEEHLRGSRRELLVFITDRDGAGACAGWSTAAGRSPTWKKPQLGELWRTVATICEKPNVRFVILSRQKSYGWPPPKPANVEYPDGEYLGTIKHSTPRHPIRWRRPAVNLDADTVVKGVCDRLDKELAVAPTQVEMDLAQRQRRFVHGMTLFRRARPLAALTSWGLIRAIDRLSDHVDNDRERAALVRRWIDALEKDGAVRVQAGGAVWMHRDIRENLQTKVARPELVERRAEAHQGIADWYVKLFRASNDPAAALESLFHRIQCVEAAKDVKGDYPSRSYLESTAMKDAISTLELARDRFRSYGYFKPSAGVFESLFNRPRSRVASVAASSGLTRRCAELLRDCARDITDWDGAFRNQQRVEMLVRKEIAKDASKQIDKWRQKGERAVILLGSRSYEDAKELFEQVLLDMKMPRALFDPDCSKPDKVEKMRRLVRGWADDQKPTSDHFVLAVRTLRRYMFLHMLTAQAYQLAGTRSKAPARNPKNLLRFAEAIYTGATDLVRFCPDRPEIDVENAYVRTHLGVVMVQLDRPIEAHRRLNEAIGLLAQSSKAHDPIAWSVVDLRRAETYLWQTERVLEKGEAGSEAEAEARALLRDAQMALERFETRLARQRRDVWWWTLWYELHLWLCVCAARLSSKYPIASDPTFDASEARVGHLLESGLRLVHLDPLRAARLIDLSSDWADLTETADRLVGCRQRLAGILRCRRELNCCRKLHGAVASYADGVAQGPSK